MKTDKPINTATFSHQEKSPDTSQETIKKQVVPWGIEMVNPYFNKIEKSKFNKVKIAVLDSGIYKEHEDLKSIVKKQYNALSPGEPVIDDFGHGTAVAGIIGANNNDVGVLGVNGNVELYDVKILDSKGKGSYEYLIKGIEWSIAEKVDIINISSGFAADKPELKNIIDKAVSSGIIVVAAAGNTYGTGVEYPAKYDNVLSINSIKKDFKRPSSAARGKIDYVTPGENILTTDHNGGYSSFTGTSFAAAHATGVISWYLSSLSHKSQKTLNVKTLRNELDSKVESHEIFEKEEEYGKGLLRITL